MPYLHSRLPFLHSSTNHYANSLACLRSGVLVAYAQFQLSAMQSYPMPLPRFMSPSGSSGRSFAMLYSFRLSPIAPEDGEGHHIEKSFHLKIRADSPKETAWNEENQLDETAPNIKEIQRREKIGLANKGKLPWNKGRKHTAETRARIKQRVIEAMKDPKVRKKLSQYGHAQSDQSKAKIQSSLRQIWAHRLKRKRSREKLYLLWAESIAKEAKKGGPGQQELEWDSYDMLKEDIAIQHLRRATDRAMAKKMAKQRAEAAARAKAEKRHSHQRNKQEQNAKPRAEIKQNALKKSNWAIKELAVVQGLKLKAIVKKVQKKELMIDQDSSPGGDIAARLQPAAEKLDLAFIKSEKMRREVSLADQIRAAKNRRDAAAMTCRNR